MTTRERLIAAGHIRPAGKATTNTPRQSMIDAGRIKPQGMFVDPKAPMSVVMRAFMIRVTGRG